MKSTDCRATVTAAVMSNTRERTHPLFFFFSFPLLKIKYIFTYVQDKYGSNIKRLHIWNYARSKTQFKNSLIGLTNGMSASSLIVCIPKPFLKWDEASQALPHDMKKKQRGGIPARGDMFLILWPQRCHHLGRKAEVQRAASPSLPAHR